ncbi:MAG: ADP-ribosylglycohydrolase family protein [Clostridia bacterium]|nr:ADP-ribosylglycohydrolase family protein [Clostridia bacterium]
MKPTVDYESPAWWEFYSDDIMYEYRQSMDEGLDVENLKDVFEAVSKMKRTEHKEAICDTLFNIVCESKTREDFKYNEPSSLEEIIKLRKKYQIKKIRLSRKVLEKKIQGAWFGRICACMLGKPIECLWKEDIWKILKFSDNFPLNRYIKTTDIKEDMKHVGWILNRPFIDKINGFAPYDDDTNYMVLAYEVIKRFGREFTPANMAKAWQDLQPKEAYCTAERRAFINFTNRFSPPNSATYKNVYREWIGAQIRGDYFGYINPQNPEMAAKMAFNDASISHIKNGIYGEMWASAMIACAFSTNSMEDIIRSGLAQIPYTSRLYERVSAVLDWYKSGMSSEECFNKIYEEWNDHNTFDWCHTISNAMIVATCLLYGEGDYSKSICMAVQAGFDTDCNGATVGSILGITNGIDGIDKKWIEPFNDTLQTTLFGYDMVKISEMAKKTLEHI